jgi:hypothetical protein
MAGEGLNTVLTDEELMQDELEETLDESAETDSEEDEKIDLPSFLRKKNRSDSSSEAEPSE